MLKEKLKNYKQKVLKEQEELKESIIDSVLTPWNEEQILNYKYTHGLYSTIPMTEKNIKLSIVDFNKKTLGVETYIDMNNYLNTSLIDKKNEILTKYNKETIKIHTK